jgi:hypothetical protein
VFRTRDILKVKIKIVKKPALKNPEIPLIKKARFVKAKKINLEKSAA